MTDEAKLLCARLLRNGTLRASELPHLPLLRKDADRLLNPVGLEVMTNIFSDHVGLRFAPDLAIHEDFDTATNLGLGQDACALITVLWSRLVLPTRSGVEQSTVPGQNRITAEAQWDAAKQAKVRIHEDGFVQEFRETFGGVQRLRNLLGQLRRQGFLAQGMGRVLEAGPLLELALDGEQMRDFVRKDIFAKIVAQREADLTGRVETPRHEEVLAALRQAGKPLAISALEKATAMPRRELKRLLSDLMEWKRVRRSGTKSKTTYSLLEDTA